VFPGRARNFQQFAARQMEKVADTRLDFEQGPPASATSWWALEQLTADHER